ncbi:hypothetical protein [Demequina sp.]|uniref:hypothetical protein n=1 Tax=Demequina sp. TaxID=2050685 RepID=UPI003D103879
MAVTPEIEAAISEIKDQFPEATITVVEDGDGGAYVSLDRVPLGAQYSQRETWMKFQITVTYPVSDVYPQFIDPAVRIVGSSHDDDTPMGEGSSVGNFRFANEEILAIQISRRSNHLDPAVDTAALKLAKVMHWLETRS